jgi:hypothetical protein
VQVEVKGVPTLATVQNITPEEDGLFALTLAFNGAQGETAARTKDELVHFFATQAQNKNPDLAAAAQQLKAI